MLASTKPKYMRHSDVGFLYRSARTIPLHRVLIFAVVTLLYAGLLILLYSLSGTLDLGIKAEPMPGGQWRVTYVVPAGVAFDQDVRVGDIITRVNGEDLAGSGRSVASFAGVTQIDVVRGHDAPGRLFRAKIDMDLDREENLGARWIYAATSLTFILVGGAAYLKARARKQARNLFAFCGITAGMLVVTTTPGEYTLPALAMSFLGLLSFACSFALFFLNFPTSPPVSARTKRAAAIVVAGGGFVLLMAYAGALLGLIEYAPVRISMLVYIMVCAGAALWSLGAQLLGHRSEPEARSQLMIVLLGAGIAFFPSALFNFLPALFLGAPILDIYICASTLAIMPMAFAYAISRHQLLGIDALVRRSVIQVITGVAILLLMFIPAVALARPLHDLQSSPIPGLVTVVLSGVAFLVAAIYRVIHERVELWVDKYIYHDAYDYKQALESLTRELASEPDLARLSKMALKRLCDLMNLAGAALFLVPESEWESDENYDRVGLSMAFEPGGAHSASEGGTLHVSLNGADIQDMLKSGALRLHSSYGVDSRELVRALRDGPGFGAPMASGKSSRLRAGTRSPEAVVGSAPLSPRDLYGDIFVSGPLVAPPDSRAGREALDAVNWFLCLPLRTRGKLVGVAYLAGKRTGEPFANDDITLLGTLGSHLAQALRNAQLFRARKQQHTEAIEALAASIEAKDGYTGEHCARMVSRAEAVAQQLGLDPEVIEVIRLGTILHDVGKIGIPDAILNKPSHLTPEEFEVMKKHTLIGAHIIEQVRGLGDVADIVRHHHERYDGRGYPFGLAGTDIPLGARIVSVVDTYGAMTEDRVYRVAPGHDRAVAELQKCAGSQLDPVVVEAFLAALETSPEIIAHNTSRGTQSNAASSTVRGAPDTTLPEVERSPARALLAR